MKKTIFYLAAAAAMAVACDMENAGTYRQEEGVPFSLEASISSTKTTLDTEGYKVSWEDDDALSVIAGYADGSFMHYKFEKGEGNTFSCQKVSDPGNIATLDVLSIRREQLCDGRGLRSCRAAFRSQLHPDRHR